MTLLDYSDIHYSFISIRSLAKVFMVPFMYRFCRDKNKIFLMKWKIYYNNQLYIIIHYTKINIKSLYMGNLYFVNRETTNMYTKDKDNFILNLKIFLLLSNRTIRL